MGTLKDLIVKGLALSNVSFKEACSLLKVKQSELAPYKHFWKLNNLEKLELIYSEPKENNRKFLMMCYYGGEKFIKHFLGVETLDPKSITEILMKVETDPVIVARLSKIVLEYEKLEFNKSKENKKGSSEVLDLLDKLSSLIEEENQNF